ncbi:5-hydroxytryptamine receptor 2A-like [Limulus polyphemus]|uniref:5-hydroxytryptamine receptor 2A-like n=1 Tax=Limulus polyphemus TaxID=6850 RepID=A0ABM1S4M0_LIMPO|nr:5-hydroxytryptamine receptor 2A-like [Limulus polyphemus]XP_022238575.1 5-hydroxytryptamine receptor 2A-like [Limulus polyphemus]XP_022238576.1 5-hydroxytryptamine receptor 2A-like [Limulus polyphemus]
MANSIGWTSFVENTSLEETGYINIINNSVNWTIDGECCFYPVNYSINITLVPSSTTFVNSEILWIIFVSMTLSVLILATVLGNVLVIAAILLEKNLHTVGNYLVLSLALTDLTVACLVMPLGAVYEVRQEWVFGLILCDVWTSCDVLCCTASILHLLAIAVDRYWAVTNVDYIHQRSFLHIGIMILLVWTVSGIVSFGPVLGWKDPEYKERILIHKICLVSQDIGYQVFATFASFYIPLVLVLCLYWRIYQEARKRIRRRSGTPGYCSFRKLPVPPPVSSMTEMTTFVTHSSSNSHFEAMLSSRNGYMANYNGSFKSHIRPKRKKIKCSKDSLAETNRERKAAKTLAIITGVFVMCWLPFFVVVLVMPICSSCNLPSYLFSLFVWLGYSNSMLNPIIYTIFSPDFRCAFKRMMFHSKK